MSEPTIELLDEAQASDEKLFAQSEGVKEGSVTPLHLLCLAKWILAVVGVIYVIAGIAELFKPGSALFEACKVTLPSIATLVIGYYFGSSK